MNDLTIIETENAITHWCYLAGTSDIDTHTSRIVIGFTTENPLVKPEDLEEALRLVERLLRPPEDIHYPEPEESYHQVRALVPSQPHIPTRD